MQMAGNCSQDSLSTFNCSFMEPLSDLPLTYHFANGTVDFVQADYVRREKVQEKFNVFLTYLSVGVAIIILLTMLVFWLCHKSAVNDIRNGKADIVTTQKYLTEQRKRNQIMSKQTRKKLRYLQRSVRKPRLQIGRRRKTQSNSIETTILSINQLASVTSQVSFLSESASQCGGLSQTHSPSSEPKSSELNLHRVGVLEDPFDEHNNRKRLNQLDKL